MSETVEYKPLETPGVRSLIRLLRAQDTYGAWEGKSDELLLAPFIVDKEKRKTIPVIGDPDPQTLWRFDIYYNALALAIGELGGGVVVSSVTKISHEGFGRVLLVAGRLVVLDRHVRDMHRFGFLSFERLGTDTDKLISQALEVLQAHPEVAQL